MSQKKARETIDKEQAKKTSFTAASVFPAKMLHNKVLLNATQTGIIPPLHVQLIPTNNCNLHCGFCSCSEMDRNEELKFEEIQEIMGNFKHYGTEAVTITGGGEPLMHKDINEIIKYIRYELGIEVGLVTNGLLLQRLDDVAINAMTWCRISHSDERLFNKEYQTLLEENIRRGKDVDWAFSYVLTREPNYNTLSDIIKFANEHKFTHVRVVSDLIDLSAVDDMIKPRMEMLKRQIDISRVIFQGRKEWKEGTPICLISLLKPTIAANGYIYPCCGSQYAEKEPSRNYGETMRLGHYTEIDEIWGNQKYYDGTMCMKCYYEDYNFALDTLLLNDLKHIKFI